MANFNKLSLIAVIASLLIANPSGVHAMEDEETISMSQPKPATRRVGADPSIKASLQYRYPPKTVIEHPEFRKKPTTEDATQSTQSNKVKK